MSKNTVINEVGKLSKEEILKLYKKQFEKNISLIKKLNDLQANLAESDAEIEKVEKTYIKQRDYYTKEFNEVIDNLKQQLAEKEKENLQLKNQILYSQMQVSKEHMLRILSSDCVQYNPNQDKISFCIEQLEQIKKFYNEYDNSSTHTTYEVLYQLDRKIKQLKEGK